MGAKMGERGVERQERAPLFRSGFRDVVGRGRDGARLQPTKSSRPFLSPNTIKNPPSHQSKPPSSHLTTPQKSSHPSIAMSRNRSYKTQKHLYARRKAARAASASAKPAPAHAKPAPSPTLPPKAPDSPPTKPPKPPKPPKPTSLSLVRRAFHQDRKLKARVRLVEKKTAHFVACEKHLARALEELAAARRQVGELNAAVNYLLAQEPHGGRCFDEVSSIC